MKRYFTCLLIVILITVPSAFAKAYDVKYYTYEEGGNRKLTEKHSVQIKEVDSHNVQVDRFIETDQWQETEQFVMDENFETVKLSLRVPENHTDYEAIQKDNKIILKGIWRGQNLDKTIELDDRPFYFALQYNLQKFAISDEKELKFWTIRRDTMTKYLMEAERQGEDRITVNNEQIDVIAVRFSATGIGAKFYKGTCYYRKSDGLLVRKTTMNQLKYFTADLVGEN